MRAAECGGAGGLPRGAAGLPGEGEPPPLPAPLQCVQESLLTEIEALILPRDLALYDGEVGSRKTFVQL